jgi:hypothetical protein
MQQELFIVGSGLTVRDLPESRRSARSVGIEVPVHESDTTCYNKGRRSLLVEPIPYHSPGRPSTTNLNALALPAFFAAEDGI